MEDYSLYLTKFPQFYLHSGLRSVHIVNKNSIDYCYFPTYILTSYDKKVSKQFTKKMEC